MGTYDISKINNWFNDFTSARNKFNNKYYSDFTNSYIRNCNDSAVINMYNKLNQHYEKIKRINLRVNNIWDDFLFDVQAIDNRLAGQHVNARDSLISSKLSKIQNLEEYEHDLNTKISSLSAKVGIVDKIGLAENKSASENFAEVFERCGATVATFTTSLLEGVVKLGEDGMDLLVLAGAVKASGYTSMIDLKNYITAEVKGDDSLKTNKTEQLWEDTRSFVSQDFTGFAFDSFYKNTQVGQWMKENAYGFDSVRAVGSEVGEVIAVTALSAVTGGSAAVIYGAAKTAEHTEENWQDQNVSTTGGLLKGMLQGSLDGAFFALGAKGDNIMKAAASSAVKQGEKIVLKKTAILFGKTMFECGCSIVQDESSILVNTIFSNNTIYDVNGEVLEFKNFKDKWNYYYKQAGGNEGLVISMATAGILSFASDAMDVNKIMKNTSVDTAGTRKSMSNSKNMDVSSGSKKINSDANIDFLKKEYNELLNKTKEPWFIETKKAEVSKYAVAWDLEKIKEVDDIEKRIAELEDTLNIKETKTSLNNVKSEINTNSSPSEINVGASKAEVDELYRFNNEKYKNIPGYENYYDLKRIQRNKNNLDRASEILNNWGKNQGVDNYAEQALRKYADTGSAYNVNGTPYITSSNGVRQYIESLDPQDVSFYLKNKTLGSSSNDQLYNFFRNNGSSINSTYGVNQSGIAELCRYSLNGREYTYKSARNIINNAMENGEVLPRFQKQATQEYFTLKNKLILKGMTNEQASIILSSLDDVGACSYAAKANSIFYQFSNNPELFQQKFGFPMYKVDSNGVKTFNSNELILDMYIYANDTANGGNLFTKNIYNNSYNFSCDNRIDVFGRRMLDTQRQIYMSTSNGSNVPTLNGYLNSKGLNFESYNLITNKGYNILNNQEFNAYINAIDTSITEGKSVQLNIFSDGNEIRMLSMDNRVYPDSSTRTWGEGGGHAVFITGRNIQGFTVSSWGKEYLIPYSDLQNGGYFNIMIDNVS